MRFTITGLVVFDEYIYTLPEEQVQIPGLVGDLS
jgi:hypothetical protein